MIRAKFSIRSNGQTAVTVQGHSGFAEQGQDIVCAAVSSAVYLTVNTITEVFGVQAQTEVKDGYLYFSFTGSESANKLVEGLLLHLRQLKNEYPNLIKITTEV